MTDRRANPVVVGLVLAWRASRERRWSYVALSLVLTALGLAVMPLRVALWVCAVIVMLVMEAGLLAERVCQWSDDVDLNRPLAVRLFSRIFRSAAFVEWVAAQRKRGVPGTPWSGEGGS